MTGYVKESQISQSHLEPLFIQEQFDSLVALVPLFDKVPQHQTNHVSSKAHFGHKTN